MPNPFVRKNNILADTGRLIFNVAISLYVMLDLAERFIKVQFEVWYYFILFTFVFFAIILWGVAELERIIMKRLEK